MEYVVKDRNGRAIQNAIDMAHAAGGGKIILEPGVYPSGSLRLKSNIHLHIPAGTVIQGSSDYQDYDDFDHPDCPIFPENSKKCFISCADAENITISGGGEINGQGPCFYDCNVASGEFFAKPPLPRPRMIQFFNCRNIRFSGVSFIDSPSWTIWLNTCSDVYISQIRIIGCQQMINNDGLDIDGCRNVIVSNSFFQTGDDCVVLRAIRRKRDIPAVCEQVIVSDCILNSWCQGIRIGCPSDDTIRNCQFNNITFNGKGTAILCQHPYHYLRKDCIGYAKISNLSFHNFDIHSDAYPVYICCEKGITLREIRNITFRDFRIQARQPVFLAGCANTILEEIRLSNIFGVVRDQTAMEIRFVKGLHVEQFDMTAVMGEKEPFRRAESDSWETLF